MIFNQRLLLASCLLVCWLECDAQSIKNNDTISGDKVLSEEEAQNLIENKIEKLSLIVHRKNEGDRIRKKRQFDSNYFLPGDEDEFASVSFKTVVSEIEPVHEMSSNYRDLIQDASSWSTIEHLSNVTLFWTKKRRLNPYNSLYDQTFLNYATFNPDLKRLNIHYSSPDLVQNANSNAIKSKQFSYYNQYFVVLYVIDRRYEIVTYRFEQSAYQSKSTPAMKRIQSLTFNDERVDFDLIQYQGNVYLGVSTSEGEVRLYRWNRIQFDLAADQKSEQLAGVDSLKLFRMSGTVYIATSIISTESKTAFLFSYQDTGKLYAGLRLMQKMNLNGGNFGQQLQSNNNAANSKRTSKIETFSVHGNHYLVFIGPFDCKIFWWLKSQFIEFQRIPQTAYAKDIDISYLPNNEVIIALVNFKNDLQFYTESINGEYVATFARNFQQSNIKTVNLVPFRKIHYFIFLTFFGPTYPQSTYTGHYPIHHLKLTSIKAFKERSDPLLNCLDRLNHNIKQSENQIRNLRERTSKVWLKDQEQTIRAPVIIRENSEVRSPATISYMNIKSTNPIPRDIKAVDIIKNLNRLKQLINQHQTEVNTNVVMKNARNTQKIESFVNFLTPVAGNNVIINEVNNPRLRINNVSIIDLTYNILRKSGDQVVNAPFTFANNVKINHLSVKSINGLNLNDVLLMNSKIPQNVTGHYRFDGNVFINGDVKLQETLNQIKLDQLVNLNRPQPIQVITGDKLFNIIHFNKGVKMSNGLVNGGDVRNLEKNAIKLNSNQPQSCFGKLVFLNNIETSKLDVVQPINDRVIVDEMLKYGLKKQGEQMILGKVKFNAPAFVNRDLKIDGLVNNLNIESDLLNLHHNQLFDGELIFKQPLSMMSNFNALMVNSINFTKELVYRQSPTPQVVISHKTFDQDLYINNNLTMKDASTIDYVDPSELVRHSLSSARRTFGSVTFDSLRVLGNAQTNRLNEQSINDLITKYWVKNQKQTIDVPVRLSDRTQVKIQQINTDTLNGNRFPADYVPNRPNSEQLITGSKVFVNAALLNGSFITSPNTKVNGLNLNRLDSRIVQNLQLINRRDNTSMPDFISGYKKFQTLEVEGNLYVQKLNGMRIEDDLLLRNSAREQVISGRKVFGNTPFVNVKGTVRVNDSLIVHKSINQVNLGEWLQDVVLKGSPEISSRFIENKQFISRIDTREVNLFGKLAGINFTNLLSRAIYLNSRTNEINVPITFNEPVQFNKVRLLGKLNTYDLSLYERSLVYKRNKFNQRNQPLIITGKTNILGALTVQSNLKSVYPLTTLDLGKLQNRMFSKTRMNVITAPFVFEKDLKAGRFDLYKNSKINNVNPINFVRLGGNITLPGRLVVEDALDVVKGLNVQTGSINQYNINEIYRDGVNRFGNVYLGGNYGDVIFKYLDVKGNLQTKNKLLDDIHLENEYRNKVIDANNVIETPLIFTDTVSVGNLIIRNRINDVRFDFILKDAVLKSTPQTINSTKVFIQDVIPRSKFTVHHNFNISGFLNGARLDVMNSVLLRKTIGSNSEIISSKYFNRPVYFERDLQVAGFVNKLRIPMDLVLSQTNEFINSTVIFKQPVEFINRLDLVGTYNGYPVRKSLIDRVELNKHNLDHNPIRSSLTFNDKVVVGELIVLRSINGIPINLLVPSNMNKQNGLNNLLKGKFVFNGSVRIEGDLKLANNMINNINLIQLANQTVRINSYDYLPGQVIMDRRFTFNHTQLNRKLNGIDLRKFRNYYLDKKAREENYYKNVINNLNFKDQRLGKQVDNAFSKKAYLEYFENYDEFDPLDANGRELIFDRFLTTPFVLDNQFDGDYIMQPTVEHLTAWRIVNRKKRDTKSANSYCDHYETWSYVLNEYDDLVLQQEKIVHRAFPAFKLTLQSGKDNRSYIKEYDDDENTFYLWSNTTGCHLRTNPYERYSRANIPYEVTLLYTSQFTEIGKMKRRIYEPHTHKNTIKSAIGRLDGVSAVMEDARFFTDKNNHHYAFVAFSYSKVIANSRVNSTLYEFDQKKNKWFIRQQLLSEGAVAVDLVHYYPSNSVSWYMQPNQNQRITLLAIANRLTSYDQNRKNVIQSSVYAFNDQSKQFYLIAQVPTYSPKAVLFLPIYKNLKYANSSIVRQTEHEDLFLIYANEKLRYYDECSTHEDLTLEKSGSSRSSLFNQGVSIYRISKSNLTFTLHQKLDIVGSITLDKFYLPSNQAYIVVGSKILHKTFIYYYDRYTEQFVLVQTIATPSVENVKIFWSKYGHLYLAIASSKPGASKRLKAIINGPNPLYLKNLFLEYNQ